MSVEIRDYTKERKGCNPFVVVKRDGSYGAKVSGERSADTFGLGGVAFAYQDR